MTSSARSAINRFIKIADEKNYDEVIHFLSKEKGFRREQFGNDLTVPHFLAGREFESADEANEWLSYLFVQQNQNIDEQSVYSKLRPIFCACMWGNIFGVKWLVSHGANVNVRDRNGRSPYSLACASSVDRMKKLICLEEHGYILLPCDIVWAAPSQFASSEEANDVFHHIVNEKGSSVGAIDRYGNTALHRACSRGSIFGVKWLVEHHAVINIVNKDRKTPFMLACESSVDRLSKVLYLGERGADCLAKDLNGQTALFYATVDSMCEKDVKHVLRYLVVKKGIDVNSADEEKKTPLLDACDNSYGPSFHAIQQLIELGADVSARDRRNQNALHRAAENYAIDKSIIDLLIKKGVDVTCEDMDGNTPYQLAQRGPIRMHLRRHCEAVRFSVLQRQKVRPDSIKLCVIGSEMAGKTTFTNSLLQLDRPPVELEDRTAGIEIHNCHIPGVGKGTTWDFGSQSTFHSAHGLFFQQSNTMFFLVLPFRKGRNMTSEIVNLLEEGRFWCAFAKASLRRLPSHLGSLIRLFMIFNLIGLSEEAGIEVRFQFKRVAEVLQKEFDDTFQISHVIELDCSKSQSVRMNDCREKLKIIREEMLEAADDVPKLCHAIEERLSLPEESQKSPLAYFLTAKEFEKWVAEEVGIKLSDDEKKVAIEYLDSSGIVVNMGRRICVRPFWLCHNVIGPLLAPAYFLFGMPAAEKCGKASREYIESALMAFQHHLKQKGVPSQFSVTADEAIEVLLDLELCIPVENTPGVYQIPALLDNSISCDAWKEDSSMDVYRGQRYECVHPVDIISPSSFVVLQSRFSRLTNTSHEVWKDGVKLVRIVGSKVIECLIQLGVKMGHHGIDVILRWSSKVECEAVAKEFLNELKAMIARASDERSPGVALNWFYLDSSSLRRLGSNPATYSSSEVDQKVNEKALDDILFSTRPEKRHRSSIRDLVIVGESDSEARFPLTMSWYQVI
ncbi:death-associated protein kinase 1-like isoform X3 [Oscarella lobularis]|uniref:death-associated protein kinase 1-like isoform X3 n=1 Tax=Oscarella lobularis TaxID=121494 RepID=UPI0033138B8B